MGIKIVRLLLSECRILVSLEDIAEADDCEKGSLIRSAGEEKEYKLVARRSVDDLVRISKSGRCEIND